MNKIERFRAMLRGEAVDRLPMGIWFHFPPAYHSGAAMAEAHLEYYRATDLDVMKVMNDSGYAPIGRLSIHCARDWRYLEPTPPTEALFRGHIEGLTRIVAAVGGEVPVMTTAFNPYNQAIAILRAGNPAEWPTSEAARRAFLQQLRSDPAPVLQGLDVITEDLIGFYRGCVLEGGVSGIYFSSQGGERGLMTDEEHERWVKVFDLRLLRAINEVAEFTVGHFCGRALALERFRDYPVSLVNWAPQSANLPLAAGRSLFGKPVLGGLDERGPLVTGARSALAVGVREAISALGPRASMLGAGCTVPGDIDLGNIVYARDVAREVSAAMCRQAWPGV